jgi:hypothetical protein
MTCAKLLSVSRSMRMVSKISASHTKRAANQQCVRAHDAPSGAQTYTLFRCYESPCLLVETMSSRAAFEAFRCACGSTQLSMHMRMYIWYSVPYVSGHFVSGNCLHTAHVFVLRRGYDFDNSDAWTRHYAQIEIPASTSAIHHSSAVLKCKAKWFQRNVVSTTAPLYDHTAFARAAPLVVAHSKCCCVRALQFTATGGKHCKLLLAF